MCKEDIRLARAANPTNAVVATPTANGILFLRANSERYALSAMLRSAMNNTMSGSVTIFAVIGNLEYPLIGLSQDHPAGHVSLVDVGMMVCGDIYARLNDALYVGTVVVAETSFQRPQEDI